MALNFDYSADESVDARLGALDLKVSLLHDAFRAGLARSRNRSKLAAPNAAGSDVYHDSWELLAQMLNAQGWVPAVVEQQPRMLHPSGRLSLTIASAEHVADPDPRVQPRTNPKGLASRLSTPSTTQIPLPLEEFGPAPVQVDQGSVGDLWFSLYECTGEGLNLSVARPSGFSRSGAIVQWAQEIPLPSLRHDDDLSAFGRSGAGDDIFDVDVSPRR